MKNQTQKALNDIKRFALTHINRDGMRQLTSRNIASAHFDTRAEGDGHLKAFLKNNTEKLLAEVYGKQALGTFSIREIDCYPSGDAIGIYLDDTTDIKPVAEGSGIYNAADKEGFERGLGGIKPR